jgi:hypothetical protein
MASWGRNTDDDVVPRSEELIVMGEEREKLSVQRFMFAIATTRSVAKKLRSILGVLSCLTLRIWRLWARTKNEYTMAGFSISIIREPWLLEKILCFCCFHLASRKEFDATRSSRYAARDQVSRDFQKTITKKKKATKRVPKFSCTKDTSCGNFRIILLTSLLNLWVGGVDNSLF